MSPLNSTFNLSLQAGKSAQPLKIPDRLDPGYSTFEIWIEEPSGERRRYRSTKHYCATNTELLIGARDKFQRDISIFAESGSYTFRKAGIHRIWAIFQVSNRRILQSKPIEVMVRSRHLHETRAQRRLDETRRLLTTSVRTLFYRSGFIRPREVAALEELIARHPREHSGAAAQYALGRFVSRPNQTPPNNEGRMDAQSETLSRGGDKSRGVKPEPPPSCYGDRWRDGRETRIETQSGLSSQFTRIVETAQIGGRILRAATGKGRKQSSLSFHSLRHSFVSALANAGVASDLRQKLAGHTDSRSHATLFAP
jgi:hypothetical protein